jgi:hypothetical protein
VAKLIIVLVLIVNLLHWQLQLTLHLPHEHIVYQHIIILHIQFVLNAHQFELPLHLLTTVQLTQSIHDINKTPLVALQLRSQQITHTKNSQIEILLSVLLLKSCFDEMMDEYAQVFFGEFNSYGINLGGSFSYFCEAFEIRRYRLLFA